MNINVKVCGVKVQKHTTNSIKKTLSPCNHSAVILSNARQRFKHFSGFPFPCKMTFLRSAYY